MKPQNFRDCREPWRLRHVVFFTNRLKLVNSIPGLETQNLFLKKFRHACGNLTTPNKHGNQGKELSRRKNQGVKKKSEVFLKR